jgi:hypothetical protein
MGEDQRNLQKFLIAVVLVEEREGIYESLVFVEFVLEKKQMLENSQELENLAGN